LGKERQPDDGKFWTQICPAIKVGLAKVVRQNKNCACAIEQPFPSGAYRCAIASIRAGSQILFRRHPLP
jgi:hypothetical protein